MKEKEYPPIADVMHFNRRGHGPFVETLYVRANVDPSPHYPSARIFLGATVEDNKPRDFGGVCFTLEQAKQLRKELGARRCRTSTCARSRRTSRTRSSCSSSTATGLSSACASSRPSRAMRR